MSYDTYWLDQALDKMKQTAECERNTIEPETDNEQDLIYKLSNLLAAIESVETVLEAIDLEQEQMLEREQILLEMQSVERP